MSAGDELQRISRHFVISNVLRNQDDKRLTCIDLLTVSQLKLYLDQLKEPTTGKKAILVDRLKKALSNKKVLLSYKNNTNIM